MDDSKRAQGAESGAQEPERPKSRTISFAAGLAPLRVDGEHGGAAAQQRAAFRTAAAIASTPLAAGHKGGAGGAGGAAGGAPTSSSILVLKPRWRHLPRTGAATAPPGAPAGVDGSRTRAPPRPVSAGRLQLASGPGGGGAPVAAGQGWGAPGVLQFESWHHEGGDGRRARLEVAFHTATGELAVRTDDGFQATLMATGPSGLPIEPWDLHVGASLSILGRRVTLRRAAPATAAWIDAEAARLAAARRRLLEALARFAPAAAGFREGGGGAGGGAAAGQGSAGGAAGVCSCRGAGQGGGGGGSGSGGGACGCGGSADLRRLRAEVALLAGRLRQFKARVPLPPDLQPLVGEGPASWGDAGEPAPTGYHFPRANRGGTAPAGGAGGTGGTGGAGAAQWRRGGGSRGGGGGKVGAGPAVWPFIELAPTPSWVGQLAEWKHEQRLCQLSGLAASAAAAGLAACGRGGGGS
ncbi:hypothetical protein Rsub_10074 [Raphidocelis subcapitata]|uniref:Uncharacterized protein n=1 Tax=Raphidocelis subcapitata TaxID=307507 RepID=A0A2V0PH15_9CHLO|nr:hypothetical protein Rsub_10074 [Raphidocelis subcapitata]|eukprot:GBF97213.1 hypothetical protein Rsub_10074 [Raphidocelis subcapitata]